MFTRPTEVSDGDVCSVLRQWGFETAHVAYLPVGFGSHHWSVATPAAGRWFLTVDDLASKRRDDESHREARARLQAALETAACLAADLDFVVAPLTAARGEVLVAIDERFVAALYRHVTGDTFDHGEYTVAADQLEVLGLLARLHATAAPNAARCEDFTIPHRWAVAPGGPWGSGPYTARTRALLERQRRLLDAKFARYEVLARAALERPERFVITHGEPHPANTIETATGRVLVDWDTALVAPPERDLWMVVEAASPLLDAYEEATRTTTSADGFELYKLQWDLMEVAGYVAFFRSHHDDTRDAQESWQNLVHFIS